jgi:hypothetical protein
VLAGLIDRFSSSSPIQMPLWAIGQVLLLADEALAQIDTVIRLAA